MNVTSHSEFSTARHKLIIKLYKDAFPAVATFISNRGGSFDEARDIFHDALVVYYEKSITSNLNFSNDTAYLIGIAKNLWLKKYRESTREVSLDGIDVSLDDADEMPSANRLLRFLEKAGQQCMELLKGFYYDQLQLTDIAERFGFSGVRSATVQKYKCLEKVRKTIKQKSLAYEDFVE